MIVVIPYHDDKHNGVELMYAIRSMVKHFVSMTGLIVVGDLPGWYVGDHIPMKDIPIRSEYSMYVKAMAGAKGMDVETFLYTTDDHYATIDFDESLPNYYLGTCADCARRGGRYGKMYANCPVGWLNYDTHVPIVMQQFNWGSTRLETDRPIKSNYANQLGVIGKPGLDMKIMGPARYDEIKMLVNRHQFFSTSPQSQTAGMMQVFNELYPEKSKYER